MPSLTNYLELEELRSLNQETTTINPTITIELICSVKMHAAKYFYFKDSKNYQMSLLNTEWHKWKFWRRVLLLFPCAKFYTFLVSI